LYKILKDCYVKSKSFNLAEAYDKNPDISMYAAEIVRDIATTANFKHNISLVKQSTYRRQVNTACKVIQQLVERGEYEDVTGMRNDILSKIDVPVYDPGKHRIAIQDIVMDALEEIDRRYRTKSQEKLYYGLYDIDKLTGGMHKQELTVLAARTGIGKTAFVVQVMLNLAQRGNACVLFSREMSSGQIAERLLSNMSSIDSQRIRFAKGLTEKEFSIISASASEIYDNMPIVINDYSVNTQEIRSFCREMKAKGKLDVIFVDYLQLCRTLKKTQTREREVAEMSWEFKMIAKEFDVPVMLLSQLNRASAIDNREPVLADLRDSGSIEQDADNVIFLHVPKDTDMTRPEFDIKVIIAKQRQGPVGSVSLRYQRNTYKFNNLEVTNENTVTKTVTKSKAPYQGKIPYSDN
jgi:replicative DNA helicase